jgi:sulfoxide reductase heme-binding subunit YedZ
LNTKNRILDNIFFTRWFPILVHVACLLPIPVLVFDAWTGNLSADPVTGALLRTGKIALELLVFSLACTPLNTIFGFSPALRVRRALGDYAFLYVCLHFVIFVSLDYEFEFQYILPELIKPYLLVGLIAGILLIPLAITSFAPWPKQLGKNWKRLHSLVYLIDFLAALHYILVVKQGVTDPYLWMILIIFLLFLRLPPIRHFLSGFFSHKA